MVVHGNSMRVREHLSYRTFVLDLFLRLHFMSDKTADAIATILNRPQR